MTYTTIEGLRDHMRATLVPSVESVKAAQALLDAGLGTPNGNYKLVFSVLVIHGNEDARTVWLGTETVTDPGVYFLDRNAAWEHNRQNKPEGGSTAVVYHSPGKDGHPTWAVFID